MPVADIFDNELTSENEGENVIQVFEGLSYLLGLPVPMEGEDNSVDDYAHHDEKLDILALSDEKKWLSVFIVGHFHPVLRLSLQNIETIFDPLFLFLGQV